MLQNGDIYWFDQGSGYVLAPVASGDRRGLGAQRPDGRGQASRRGGRKPPRRWPESEVSLAATKEIFVRSSRCAYLDRAFARGIPLASRPSLELAARSGKNHDLLPLPSARPADRGFTVYGGAMESGRLSHEPARSTPHVPPGIGA